MNMYLVFILAILISDYVISLVVEALNVRYLKTDLPEEFQGYYDPEKYKTAQNYLKENTRFGIITDTIFTPLTVAFILLGGFNFVDQFARSFNLDSIPTGLIFAGILLLMTQILHIPFSAYSTFVIEEKYGFNKTTVKTFIFDKLNMSVDLSPCKTEDFPSPAPRPLNSRFDCSKITALLQKPIEPWQGPLQRFLVQL